MGPLQEDLLEAIARELADGEWDGPPVYVVVPDAAALEAEREILRRLAKAGSLRLRVVSPARLAGELLRAMGKPQPQPLSDAGVRARVRLLAAAQGSMTRLGLPPQTVAGAERRLAQTVNELLWHQDGMPDAAKSALGRERAAVLRGIAQALRSGLEVPESVLFWRCAAALREGGPPGSVHWAAPRGLPAREALRAALTQSRMPFRDWEMRLPSGAREAVRATRVSARICPDLADEARAAVLHIRELLAQGAQPGEITVGLADPALRPELGKLLLAARIPADLGGAGPEGQPLTELIGGLCGLAVGGQEEAALLRVVGSGLVPPPGPERDEMLGLLRSPRGGAGLDRLPPALLPGAAGWPLRAPFQTHLRHLGAWLARLGLPQATQQLGDEAAAIQDQIWNAFWTLAQGLAANAGDSPVPRETALRAVLDLLGAARPAQAPQRGALRVLGLGALPGTDARHLLLLGLTEAAFPPRQGGHGLLSADLMDALRAAGAAIGRGPRELREAAQEAALGAVAAARETLWLSGAARSAQGTAQGFSPLAAEILAPEPWAEPPLARGGLAYALSAEEAGNRIASSIARMREIHVDPKDLLPLASAYAKVFGDGPHLAGFRPRRPEEPVGRVDGEIAVTALEQFGACRFRWLGQRLRLGSEEIGDALDPRLRGTLVHRVLSQLPYEEVPEEELPAAVRDAVEAAVAAEDGLFALRDAAGPRGRTLREQTALEILRAARMIAAERRRSAFRVLGREIAFGEGKPLKALRVPLPGGGTAALRGRIDRLEEAQGFLRVTDFKVRSNQRFDMTLLLRGVDLQVGAYLLAALHAAGDGRRAAVAAYWPVRVGVRTPAQEADPSPERIWGAFRQRGLFLGDPELLPLLDRECPDGRSPFHPLALNKDGAFPRSSPVVPERLWPELEQHLARTLGRLAEELTAGAAEPNPYYHNRVGACATCDLLPVCRYEAGVEGYRRLTPMRVEEVADA